MSLLQFHRDMVFDLLPPHFQNLSIEDIQNSINDQNPLITRSNSSSSTALSYDNIGTSDGLLIIAKGLGLRHVLLTFLKLHADPSSLVLLLNTPAPEVESLREDLWDAVEIVKKRRESLLMHQRQIKLQKLTNSDLDLNNIDDDTADNDTDFDVDIDPHLLRVINNETPALERYD